MLKARKSSRSPCYLIQDKQNLQLLNNTSSTNISFKTLELQRQKKNGLISPHTDTYAPNAKSSHQTLRDSPNNYNWSLSRQKQIHKSFKKRLSSQDLHQQYALTLQSKESQLTSLHCQTKLLTNTITLLHQQIASLSSLNQTLHSQNKKINQELKMQQKLSNKAVSKISKLNDELKGYYEILPKLGELEEVQDQLVKDNKRLTRKVLAVDRVLKSVRKVLVAERDEKFKGTISLIDMGLTEQQLL